ncbi:MAG: hypothetical protein MJ247_03925 [Alphaproteobacteria bacterium]|nr:hypothetical protein [Alphaproteobacteria bacterium]
MKLSTYFYSILKKINFPKPDKAFELNGFLRWGNKNRFYAKFFNEDYLIGDFSTGFQKYFSEFNRPFHIDYYDLAEIERQRNNFCETCKKQVAHIWENASNITYSHPYLLKKQALSTGLKIASEQVIIVPIKSINDELYSLQFISLDGKTRFYKGGLIKGNFFMYGKPNKKIFICHDFFNASSIYQAFKDDCVVCCFLKSNIEPVAKILREKYKEIELIFCSDNSFLNQENNEEIDYIKSIANGVNGKIIIPSFNENDNQSSSFNDIHCWYGINCLKNQIIPFLKK